MSYPENYLLTIQVNNNCRICYNKQFNIKLKIHLLKWQRRMHKIWIKNYNSYKLKTKYNSNKLVHNWLSNLMAKLKHRFNQFNK